MFQFLIKIVRRKRIFARLKNRVWTEAYLQYSCWPEHVHIDPQTEQLTFDDSGLCLDKTQAHLLPFQALAKNLAACGACFGRSEAGKITVTFGDLHFLVQIDQDLAFLNDVFYQGSYNIRLPHSHKKRVLWDIGMNVGFASLFFAHQEDFEAVVGYEPFPETYREAERHFTLNPIYSGKITAINKGIGDKNETLSIGYKAEIRGNLSALEDLSFGALDGQRETVVIENAATALRRVLEQYPNREIIVKMDCEGAEHKILPALHQAGLLNAITALMIEWHGEGKDQLEEILTANNFVLFSSLSAPGLLGYIYAVQSQEVSSYEAERASQARLST